MFGSWKPSFSIFGVAHERPRQRGRAVAVYDPYDLQYMRTVLLNSRLQALRYSTEYSLLAAGYDSYKATTVHLRERLPKKIYIIKGRELICGGEAFSAAYPVSLK